MKLKLADFQLEPFQRFFRYPILLESIKTKLEVGSADFIKVQAAQTCGKQVSVRSYNQNLLLIVLIILILILTF